MYKTPLTLLIIIFSTFLTFGQKTIVGKILSQTTKEPIPFANIGVINSNVGTLSNLDGTFSIIIPQKLITDSLTFRSLGFYGKSISVNQLESRKEFTVYLNEKATLLSTVIITAKKIKYKKIELGNRVYTSGNYEPDTTYAGRSVALLIDTKNIPNQKSFPVYLKKASLCIFRNNFESFKFRVRINKYDSLTGKPGVDLIDQSIIEESSMQLGWLDFDLSKLNFRVTGPFFVTFEQLLDSKHRTSIAMGFRDILRSHPEWFRSDSISFDGKKQYSIKLERGGIELPGTFIGASYAKSEIDKYSCYVRKTSLGEWYKIPAIMAATVTLSGQFIETKEVQQIAPPQQIR
jgi:hypothetical protein